MKIGIVSCNKWMNKIKEDQLLKMYLEQEGCDASIISWEDDNCEFTDYSAIILRSVWGYQNRYSEFKKWLLKIKELGISMFNNPDIVLDNIRKDKQFEILKNNDIPFINTKFIYNIDDLYSCLNNNLLSVVKPIISGSGENTFIINEENKKSTISLSELKQLYSNILLESDNGIMVQPFIESVENGEFSCIYIDGKNTHNMLRFPGIFASKKKPIFLNSLPEDVLKLSKKVSLLEEYKDYLYMRVDIVLHNDMPLIMEVELAEPDLLTKYIEDENIQKESIKVLSKSICRRVKQLNH